MAVNGLTSNFPALGHRLYRRLLLAQLLFETGLTIFEVALFWTAAQAVGAHAFVGALFALIVLPASLMAVPSGLVADRLGPRALVAGGGAVATGAALVAAVLSAGDRVGAVAAVLLAVTAGLSLGAWSVPSQVIAGRAVPAEILPGAIALSLLPSGAGAIGGGAAGGLLLGAGGAPAGFLAAAVVLAGAGVAAVRLRTAPVERPVPGPVETAPVPARPRRDGPAAAAPMRRILAVPMLWGLVALAATMSLFLVGRVALFPALVSDVLHGGPDQLGMLVGVGGLGILAGALATEPCGRLFGRGPTLFGAVVVAAAGFAALGFTRSPLLSVALACLTAAATITWQVTSAATVQLSADPRDRGKLLGVYDLFRLALIPVGSVGLGALADAVGVTATCLIAGGATVLGAAATAASNRSLRRLRSMPSPTP